MMISVQAVFRVTTLHIICGCHVTSHLVRILPSFLIRRRFYRAKKDQYRGLIQKRERQCMYILDKGVAKLIADTVPKSCIVVECNPGPGFVTRALLDAGVKKIIAVEGGEKFLPDLKALRDEVGEDRLDVHHMHFFLRYRRHLEGLEFMREIENKIMECIPQCSWTDRELIYGYMQANSVPSIQNVAWSASCPPGGQVAPPVCIIGVLPPMVERLFLPYLFYGLATQESFFSKGRVQWLLTLSPPAVRSMSKREHIKDLRMYHRKNVLCEIFYDLQFIKKLDRELVFPPYPIKKTFLEVDTAHMFIDRSSAYLTQLTPRADLMTKFLPEELPGFMVFLQQIMQRRKWRLIARMEYLVPGCSAHLLAMNFKATQTTGMIRANEYVYIYKQMLNWPEYQDSSLQAILSKSTSYLTEDYVAETEVDDHAS